MKAVSFRFSAALRQPSKHKKQDESAVHVRGTIDLNRFVMGAIKIRHNYSKET